MIQPAESLNKKSSKPCLYQSLHIDFDVLGFKLTILEFYYMASLDDSQARIESSLFSLSYFVFAGLREEGGRTSGV